MTGVITTSEERAKFVSEILGKMRRKEYSADILKDIKERRKSTMDKWATLSAMRFTRRNINTQQGRFTSAQQHEENRQRAFEYADSIRL